MSKINYQDEVREDKKNSVIEIYSNHLGKAIFLSIITLGIYAIYWMYLLVKNTRAIEFNRKSCIGEILCLVFVPFYHVYWWYTRGTLVRNEISERGKGTTSSGVLLSILALFGLQIVSNAIMQKSFNHLADGGQADVKSIKNKIRFEKREKSSALRTLITTIIFVALALVFCGILIVAVGSNPLEVYETMFSKAFLSSRGIEKMLRGSLPLMFCGLGVALTFKMNLSNIGAEGQYAIGAIAGGAFVLMGPKIEGPLGILLVALCCFLGGAFWAFLCAVPKALWNVNESITTLMMNYIALAILAYLCMGPWKMQGQNVGQTDRIPKGLELPEITIGEIDISVGIIFGILVAVAIFLAYKCTTSGYQLTVISHSLKSAEYAGINIKKNILLVMTLSGGLAGLAGFTQYAGVTYRIAEGMTYDAGYTAIVIAYLARLNPLAVVVVSVLFAGLQNSTVYVQSMGVPSQIATMMQGAIMLFVIAGEFFQRYKLIVTREEKA